jgi:hypothetical protein
MEIKEYKIEDFIVPKDKVFNSGTDKGKYSLFLVSDADKNELISALKTYFGQLRKKRSPYVKSEKQPKKKNLHNEPNLIMLSKDITKKDAKIITQVTDEYQDKHIPIINIFKSDTDDLNKEIKKCNINKEETSDEDDISEDESSSDEE